MNVLIPAISDLIGLAQSTLEIAFLVFLRVGAMMALLPAFGEQAVPQRIKLVLALAFTAVTAPALAPQLAALNVPFPTLMATETIAGLLLGIGLRLFVHALQIAGAIAAQATTLSQFFGGAGPEPQPAFTNVLVVAGLAAAVATGLHIRVAEMLILSYAPLPAGQWPGSADVSQWGLRQVARAFSLGFVLAAPFTIASVIYNVALGVINRAMPQLMMSMIGAPALTLGGLALLALSAPMALALWIQTLNAYAANPFAPVP
jgi:flagellar biosynthesis protein FliR